MALIASFGGIYPRLPWHHLPETAATVAHNAKLRNQKLQAWRERSEFGDAVPGAASIFTKGCCLLSWDKCVSCTDYLVDYGRLYLTGRSTQPEIAVLNNCIPTYYFLGVPAPASAPALTATETFGEDCDSRSYVITYVNQWGEEGAPSPASRHITVRDGTMVTLTGIVQPPAGYGIEAINVYRTQTAERTGQENEQVPGTLYVYVGTAVLGETTFVDTLLGKFTGWALDTREVNMPPANMQHLRHMEGTGALVGHTAKRVHFSENLEPYNWPIAYELTVQYNIVNLVTVNNYVFVSTDGAPILIDGSPDCDPRQARNTIYGSKVMPDISCGHANSAISTPFGMVYSSKDGLVLFSPDGNMTVITAQWFSTDDWAKIRPDTVRLGFHRGYLFCATDRLTFVLEIDGTTYADYSVGALTTLSDSPIDMHTTSYDELLMLEGTSVYHWQGSSQLRPFTWISKPVSFGGRASPNSCKIRGKNVKFTLLTDKENIFWERDRLVVNEEPFRVGRIGRHVYYRIRLDGTGDVEFVDLGTSFTTVNYGT